MPTFTMTKNWDDGQVLTESMLDDIKNSVETFLNVTKLDSDNLAAGAVATATIADGSVTSAKLATSVAGNGLTGGAGTALAVVVDDSTIEINSDSIRVKDVGITAAKLATDSVTTAKILAANVTTAKIADLNVTTGKIADAAVTADKIAAAVAGNGLTGGAGTALAVAVDDSTIEISADALRLKDAGITAAKLATDSVTTVKILNSNVTTAKIADANVTADKLAAAVAGAGLSGGAGTALAVNVDASTIEISTDTLQVKDAGITAAKLAAAVAGNGLAGGAGIALSVNVDGSTIEINSDTLRVKDSGIVTAKIADANVTRAKMVTVGQQLSSSCGTFTTTSTSYVDVTALTVTITTTGRPVMVFLQCDASGSTSFLNISSGSVAVGSITLQLLRGATTLGQTVLAQDVTYSGASFGSFTQSWGPGAVLFLDGVAAGTYTYKVQAKVSGASMTGGVNNVALMAYEL